MEDFNKLISLAIFFLIISCESDIGSETITDNNNNQSGGTFVGGGSSSPSELSVELITKINEQTASFFAPFGGYNRSFIVHVPPNFDPNISSLPLVFILHGYTSTAPTIRSYSNFDNIADQENFIVVYVQGTTDNFSNTGWNVDLLPSFSTVDDVGFFRSLISYFKSNYNVANDKIFSAGMSLGGFMSYRLACELEEINSIGSVTGSMSGYYSCSPPNKKNIIHFHGTADTVVPYNGSDWTRSATNAHNFWSDFNNCNNTSEINLPDLNNDGTTSSVKISSDCEDGTIVQLYTLPGEGHTWFKREWGHDISSSITIWNFFKNQIE